MPEHHRPGGFRNPWPGGRSGGLGGLLRWLLYERLVHGRPLDPPRSAFPIVASAFVRPRAPAPAVTLTWIGHSTFLIQIGGHNVLTDPMWSARASPVSFAGPRRWVAPAVALDALPPIDTVLLSHNHYDHLDVPTVRRLAALHGDAGWLVPLGLASFVRQHGVTQVVERDWWEAHDVGPLTVTAAPAQHFSSRHHSDRDVTLWCSWAVRAGDRAVYFGGDSGLHPEFGIIGQRLGPFDAALLPVGAYEPRWFMRPVHMNPEDAVQAYRDLTAGDGRAVFGAMHWGTFKLTDEPMDEPPRRLHAAWSGAGLAAERLWIPAHGGTLVL